MAVDEWLSTTDIAKRLGVAESTVRYWTVTGRGPASFKLGKVRRYRAEDVEAWIAANTEDDDA